MNDSNTQTAAKLGRSGFTLVGICVSMALITVIAAIAIPAFFGRADVTLDNAAELLASDLRSGQNRAAFLDRQVNVHFFEEGDGYWIDDSMSAASETVPLVAHRIYSKNAVFEGVRIEAVDYESEQALSFVAFGAVSTSTRITLALGSETRVVTIEAPSGQMKIEGTTRGWIDDGY